ncbi:RiPP maturation radical SAM C-methyltransferase, partial [Methylogaea oryzae]|uniref:RiPP maturation radical SAM C-methyltransferase n=1 Tax=Methylogaea oryzae TaxID=1295382 RepID=UPI0012E32C70
GKARAPRAAVSDMDRVAIPDFDDYFAAIERMAVGKFIKPGLLYESSRGCWWGARSQCTFCGLNGSSIGYRSKSPERVLEELSVLSEKYAIKSFEFVDNILDMDYFNNVLPALAERGYTIFFETKSNLSRRHVKSLAEAGIKWIQPGIESIHDGMLKLIAKGCSAAINIQLLKWAEEFGVCIFWIFLVNLPHERDEWYAEMADIIPYIVHLQPPLSITPLQYHRFSRYHADPESYGVELKPLDIYKYIYPVSEQVLSDLVYFFELKAGAPAAVARPGFDRLTVALREWWGLYDDKASRPVLEMSDAGAALAIADTRSCAEKPQHLLSGLARTIYEPATARNR